MPEAPEIKFNYMFKRRHFVTSFPPLWQINRNPEKTEEFFLGVMSVPITRSNPNSARSKICSTFLSPVAERIYLLTSKTSSERSFANLPF